MAVRSSGRLTFSEIASEFGDTVPHRMSEFVRGGSRVPNAGPNSNIPTAINSGRMRFNHFFGAVNVIAYTASNGTNLNASTAFGSSWTDNVPKELIIPSGVTIGSSSTGTAALILPTGMGGTLTIKNSGSVQGAGGAVGATGGDAILVQVSGITIENSGSIYAGGGGGGVGGAGGNGQSTSTSGALGSARRISGSCTASCQMTFGGDAFCSGSCVAWQKEECSGNCNGWDCGTCKRYIYTNTTGGAGGAGGVGQGYSQSAASGSAGASGGTNAGSGGTGGTGGAFGATGSTGATGANGNVSNGSAGSAGGLAGYYVNGIGNVTFSVTGTVGGRTT